MDSLQSILGLLKNFKIRPPYKLHGGRNPELEFLNSLWGLGTEYRDRVFGPPGYIGWRNGFLFLAIDFRAPKKF